MGRENNEEATVLVIHSAAGHSGKTTICRALVRDLPFEVYIKLSRRSPQLTVSSLCAGDLLSCQGDTGRIRELRRRPGLPPLAEVAFVDGPRGETDAAIVRLLQGHPGNLAIVEGSCALPRQLARYLFVLPCPLPPTAKPDLADRARHADLLVVNRFPACPQAEEEAMLAFLRDLSPGTAQLAGSTQDPLFLETVEEMVRNLFARFGNR